MSKKNSHTTTLFHYTRNQNALFSILKEGLKFSYCKEQITEEFCLGLPMISFCDIPLAYSIEHVSKYGGYAIGLSKRFLLDNYSIGIGPVNYFVSNESVTAAFKLKEEARNSKKILQDISENENGASLTVPLKGKTYKGKALSPKDSPMALKMFFKGDNYNKAANKAISFMKRYEFIRNGKRQVNYDECEWRMVMPENAPLGDDTLCKWFWTESEYDSWREQATSKFIEVWSLSFKVEDINYIIIPTFNLIPNFVKRLSKIKELCGVSLTDKDRYSLVSKVISIEQIKKDF